MCDDARAKNPGSQSDNARSRQGYPRVNQRQDAFFCRVFKTACQARGGMPQSAELSANTVIGEIVSDLGFNPLRRRDVCIATSRVAFFQPGNPTSIKRARHVGFAA
jgi:hypothetical protein